jgi:CDP-diacylglycerol---serine O-phosphatidyltransferase
MQTKLKKLKGVEILPSLLTLGNLLSGFGALYCIIKFEPDYEIAAWLIFLSMAFDMLDGKIARYTKSESNFGVQLDSLADLVSFGLTPSLLMLRLVSVYYKGIPIRFIWVVAAFYLVCAALRLARFNVETTIKEDDHQYFWGLPTPGAAGVLISLVILHNEYLAQTQIIILTLPFVTILLSFLMISRFRYVHFLNRFLRVRPFIKLVEIIVIMFLIIQYKEITISLIFLTYALIGPINHFRQKIFVRQKNASLVEYAKNRQQ